MIVNLTIIQSMVITQRTLILTKKIKMITIIKLIIMIITTITT